MVVDNKMIDHPNPLLRANWSNKFFFWWLKDIVKYSQTHDLVAKDLYDTIPEDLSEPLGNNLESAWIKELDDACKEDRKPSLCKVFAKVYLWDFIKYSVILSIYIIILIVQPLLLESIMLYFLAEPAMDPRWAYLNATMFVVSNILCEASLFHGVFHLRRLGMRAKLACRSLIYKKIIRLPSHSTRKMNSSVISLLSIDVAKLDDLFNCLPFLIFVPVQLLAVTCLIWKSVGFVATVVGVTFMILLSFPIQVLHSKITLKLRAKQATRTDNRVILIEEIVVGIRAVKLYVWEKYLEKLVHTARSLEMAEYSKMLYLTLLVQSVVSISHTISTYAVMLAHALHRGVITAEKILPVAQHFGNLQLNIVVFFFSAVKRTTDTCISMKRIEDFLLIKEVESKAASIDDNTSELVSLKNVTVSLDKLVIFNNISLNFQRKALYAVIGPIGSGKSSLLKLILGELESASGEVIVRGRVSYASQEPWLFSGTIKENILLGEKYDEARYQQVVNACDLTEDFDQLSYGDKALVGDRGNNLSGGQRARIKLARAVYRDTDIYLLDDPLSAVDTRVAKRIIKKCINGLIAEKTRILVTRSTRQLNGVEKIVVLDNGRIEFRDDNEDSQTHDHPLEQLAQVMKTSETPSIPSADHGESNIDNRQDPKETEELIAKGAVKSSIYLTYVRSGGWCLAFLVILIHCAFVLVASTYNYGLGAWTKNDDTLPKNETVKNYTMSTEGNFGQSNSNFLQNSLFIFGSMVVLMILMSFLQNFFLCKYSLNVSQKLHNLIFTRLLMAPMKFFEGNSTGQVLNRFSEDTGVVDNALPYSFGETIDATANVVAVILSAVVANWWILFPCIISTSVSIWIGKSYILAIQKIKRLTGIAKSPILSFAASSLEGVATIRSCRAERFVTKDFDTRQDHQTASEFLTVALHDAFCMWCHVVNVGLVAVVAYSCIVLKNESTQAGYVGLSLMQIFRMLPMIIDTMLEAAEIFSQMTSVERMLQFTQLGQEIPIENEPGVELPSSWPYKGQIIFQHLYLRYFEDGDPALLDINCIVEAGSKVGIVGRTGAGKSSLTSALFRFAKTDGTIFIDGTDIKTIDLYRLRSKLSIIPQEPVLFRGSLRKNLDPMNKFDDDTLWSALDKVELRRAFDSLDFVIERAGSNLSIGQRQLLCLARAVVDRNKILVLDEATANVDSLTDALIQKTIRSTFKECTVLTIAHRLETVMDNDKVLVLDSGRLVEHDHPFLLLQNNSSYLFKMAEQMGQAMLQNLIDLAEQAYNSSNTS